MPEKFYFLALRKVGDICESNSHIRAGGAKIRHNNNLFQSLWAADQGEDKNTDFLLLSETMAEGRISGYSRFIVVRSFLVTTLAGDSDRILVLAGGEHTAERTRK